MKRFSIYASLGMVGGIILSTWLGPRFILWWFEPPADIGINYAPALDWALNRLVWIQIVGVVFGLIVGAFLALLLRRQPKAK